jgi:hypothetical protein
MFDIITASIFTITAVDLARSLEEECAVKFEKQGGINVMLPMYYDAQCREAGTTEAYREQTDDELNFQIYDLANAVFWPTFLILSSFCDVVEPGYLPNMKPGYFGYYISSSDRSKKSNGEKFREDKILLLETLPEFVLLCWSKETSPLEDELERGLRIMFKTKEVSLSLAFATTLFLDIHNILRGQVDNCFKNLAGTASFARASIRNNMKFHENLRIENWPREDDEAMTEFSE